MIRGDINDDPLCSMQTYCIVYLVASQLFDHHIRHVVVVYNVAPSILSQATQCPLLSSYLFLLASRSSSRPNFSYFNATHHFHRSWNCKTNCSEFDREVKSRFEVIEESEELIIIVWFVDNTYMSSARTRVTRVRASVRIQRMVKMRELAREVRDSERTDERRPPPPAHRPSATQPILCHLKQKARFPLLVFHL